MRTLTTKFGKYIEEIKELHPNDDFQRYKKWEELTKMFSADIIQTISLLEQATKEEILWTSEVFEELAFIVKSPEYIECLERLAKKFPSLDLQAIVEIAKSYHSAS